MAINLKGLKNIGGPKVQSALFKVQRYSPEILTGVGIISGITSAILMARATLKLEAILEQFQMDVADTKEMFEDGSSEQQKALAKVYIRFGFQMTKLYGPSVSLGIGSIASILGAHGIMKRRQVAILAAYKTVESAFHEYRKRVIEEFGTEKDEEFRRGIYTEKVKNEETGKTETIKSIDPNGVSKYAKFFDEGNINWERNPELNLLFLTNQQRWANDKLQARGHLFLNEVYDDLGMERTQAGAVVGWVIGEEGDNFVDFGIYDPKKERTRAFVNGNEAAILLDFNVDGVIIDKI